MNIVKWKYTIKYFTYFRLGVAELELLLWLKHIFNVNFPLWHKVYENIKTPWNFCKEVLYFVSLV